MAHLKFGAGGKGICCADHSQRAKHLLLKLKETNWDEAELRNPDHVLLLPYPSIDTRLPERVSVVYDSHLQLPHVRFMGREKLTEVINEMDTLQIELKRVGPTKVEAENAIARCGMHQFMMRAVSMNDENKPLVERKQTNQRMLRLDGELSEVSSAIRARCALVCSCFRLSSIFTHQICSFPTFHDMCSG